MPLRPLKTLANKYGCGEVEAASEGDGVPYCSDERPEDRNKSAPGACGGGEADSDSDDCGCFPDRIEEYPQDRDIKVPPVSSCRIIDSGSVTDNDGVALSATNVHR